jgi:hypothetical protein
LAAMDWDAVGGDRAAGPSSATEQPALPAGHMVSWLAGTSNLTQTTIVDCQAYVAGVGNLQSVQGVLTSVLAQTRVVGVAWSCQEHTYVGGYNRCITTCKVLYIQLRAYEGPRGLYCCWCAARL